MTVSWSEDAVIPSDTVLAFDAEALSSAIEAFASALRVSPEFMALLDASKAIAGDRAASAAMEAFGARQAELRLELMMGTIDVAQRAELENLQLAMYAVPTVATYRAALAVFQNVCRETAAAVSAQIGMDFAANCRSGGCCG